MRSALFGSTVKIYCLFIPFLIYLDDLKCPSISRVKGRARICRPWYSPRSHGKGPGVWEDLLISSWPWFLGQKDMKSYTPSTQIHQISQFVFNSFFFFLPGNKAPWLGHFLWLGEWGEVTVSGMNGVIKIDGILCVMYNLLPVQQGTSQSAKHTSPAPLSWVSEIVFAILQMVNSTSPGNLTLDSASSVLRTITHTLAVRHFQ